MDEIVGLGVFDEGVVGIDVGFVMLVVELVEEFAEGVFDLGRGRSEVDIGKLFDKFSDIVGDAGEGSVGEVVDAVAESVAIDFFVQRERAAILVAAELHVGSVEAGFAFHEVANGGVLDNHLGPEGIAWEAEKVGFLIGGDFDDDVSPAGEDMLGFENLALWEGVGDNLIQWIIGRKKNFHMGIIIA